MDKKFLGLGFTFAAIDDGLKNAFRQMSNQFSDVNNKMQDMNKSGEKMFEGDGFFGKIMDFAKLGGIGSIIGQIKDLKKGLLGEDAADATFETLERFVGEMQWAGKMTAIEGKRMTSSLMGVSTATGAAPDELSKVVVGLMKSGVEAGKVSENMQRMGELIGFFKMDVNDVQNMFRVGLSEQLSLSTQQMDDLVKQSLAFSRGFGMPPDLASLPKILEAITTHSAFKNLRGGAALEAAKGIQKMSVMFQALGKAPEAAGDAAIAMFEKMKGMEKSFSYMMSGLDGDVQEFYRSALIAGPKSAVAAMQSNDPSLMFQRLRDAMVNAQKAGGQTAAVVRNWIDATFGPDVTRAVTSDWNKVGKGLAKSSKAAKTDNYEDYVKIMKSTVSHTQDLVKATEQAMEIQLKFATSKEIQAGLELKRRALMDMTAEILRGDTTLGAFAKTAEIFEKAGLTGLLLQAGLAGKKYEELTEQEKQLLLTTSKGGVVLGLFGESWDKILTKMAVFGVALYALKIPFKIVTGTLGWLGRSLGLLSTVVGGQVEKIGLLSRAWSGLVKGMKYVLKAPFKLIGKMFSMAMVPITGIWNATVGKMIASLKSLLAAGLQKVFSSRLWISLSTDAYFIVLKVKDKIVSAFNLVVNYFKSMPGRILSFMGNAIKRAWTSTIGRAIDAIKSFTSAAWTRFFSSKLWMNISEKAVSVFMRIRDKAITITRGVIAFFKGIPAKMLAPFKAGYAAVAKFLGGMGARVAGFFAPITQKISSVLAPILAKFGAGGGIIGRIFGSAAMKGVLGFLARFATPIFAIADAVYILNRDWQTFKDGLVNLDIGQKIAAGLELGSKVILEVMDDILFGIPTLISKRLTGKEFKDAMFSIGDSFAAALEGPMTQMADMWMKLVGPIETFYLKSAGFIARLLTNPMATLSEAWKDSVENMKIMFADFVLWSAEQFNKLAKNIPFFADKLKISDEVIESFKDMKKGAEETLKQRDQMRMSGAKPEEVKAAAKDAAETKKITEKAVPAPKDNIVKMKEFQEQKQRKVEEKMIVDKKELEKKPEVAKTVPETAIAPKPVTPMPSPAVRDQVAGMTGVSQSDEIASAVAAALSNVLANANVGTGDGKTVQVQIALVGDIQKFIRIYSQSIRNAGASDGTYSQRGING